MADTEDETSKPLFLRAQDSSTWEKPEETSWGDHFLNPDKPLCARHKALAKMVAMGCTTTEIADKLDYTMARVSVLKSNTKIKMEIERCQDRMHEEDLEERIKHLAPDALDTMEEILLSVQDPLKREAAAKWILEKVTGKATQQVDVKGEINLGVFLQQLDKMGAKQSMLPNRDVTPKQIETSEILEVESKPVDLVEDWLDKHLDDD